MELCSGLVDFLFLLVILSMLSANGSTVYAYRIQDEQVDGQK
jgi:hypothetical protein